MDTVERLENVDQNNGENVLLKASDIIISNMEPENGILDTILGVKASETPSPVFCQIVQLYENGKILARVLGTDASLVMKVNQVMVNLSFVGAKEQAHSELKRTRESWKPGRPVEVYSRSLKCWCVGYVCKCIELREKRVAHGDLWFQLVYFHPSCTKLCYKQVKFDETAHLTDVSRYKGSELWEQFHQKLSQEKHTNLPRILQEPLRQVVQPHLLSADTPSSSKSVESGGFSVEITDNDGDKIEFKVGPNNTIVEYVNNQIETHDVKGFVYNCDIGKYYDDEGHGTIPFPERLNFARKISRLFEKCGKLSLLDIENEPEGLFSHFSTISNREKDSIHLPLWESFKMNPRNADANYGSYTDAFNFPANAVMLEKWKAYEREHGFDNLVGACNPPTDHSNVGEPDPRFLDALREKFTKLRKNMSRA